MQYIKKFGKFPFLVICVIYVTLMVIRNIRIQEYNVYKFTIKYFNRKSVIRDTVLPQSEITKPNDTKYILLWTSFFNATNWSLETNDKDLIKCHNHDCYVTSNRDLLNSTLDYDALVFHATQPWNELGKVPAKRGPHQAYVMATLESPLHFNHDLYPDHQDFYNITMTYRLDSDVVWSRYGAFIDQQTGEQVAPLPKGRKPVWRTPDTVWSDKTHFDQVTKKSKMAAWFVSNCNAPSNRDRLVNKLQGHFPVDVYGKCGPLKCPRSSNHCNEKLDSDYKFYMAFENSLCDDYVTKRLFGTMKRLIVPVVYGGADYSLFAPPHSYIDANDFDTVGDLADYLMFLDRNPKEYVKYFWWKQFYRIEHPSPFCDLCQRLHTNAGRGEGQYYGDIDSWWKTNQCRSEARIKF